MSNEAQLLEKVSTAKRNNSPIATYASYRKGYKMGGKVSNGLTLTDPITQIARRIQAFFRGDREVITAFKINNNANIGQPTYDEHGHIIKPGDDHLAELCIYVQCGEDVENTKKADCISNWIRHRHVIPEYSFDGALIRNHVLNVRVFAVGASDPNGPQGASPFEDLISECAFIADESTQYGIGSDEKWEKKLNQLKIAFEGNPNIAKIWICTLSTGSRFGFIECSDRPVVFQEDNLTNVYGYNSELALDILTLAFVFNGEYQICTTVDPKRI